MGVDPQRHRAARADPRPSAAPSWCSPTTCARAVRLAALMQTAGRSSSGRTTRSVSARTARPTSRSSTSPRCGRSRTSTSSARPTPTRPPPPGATILRAHRPAPPGSCLTRQNLPILDRSTVRVRVGRGRGQRRLRPRRGADGGTRDVILIATGSEVQLAVAARELLAGRGRRRPRRVDAVPASGSRRRTPPTATTVLPPSVRARVSVEAGIALRLARPASATPADASRIEHFGASADGQDAVPRVRHHRRGRRRRRPRVASPLPRLTGRRPVQRAEHDVQDRTMTDRSHSPTCPPPASPSGSTTCPASGSTPANLHRLVTESQRRRRHHQPVDLRGRPGEGRPPTTTRSRELAARGADVDDTVLAAHHRRRPRRPATSCGRSTTRPDGVDGRVSIEVDPRLAHDTDADHRRRPRSCGRPSTGPTC